MRFRVEPRDVPPEMAARRLGLGKQDFDQKLGNLIARGFPKPDPDTGHYDSLAIDRWCDSRHPQLFGLAPMTGRDASACVQDRITAMKAGARHG